MSLNFIPGYSVKPAKINSFGVVSFTDGENELTPNQQQCQAYGYKYDTATGTCYAYKFSPKLLRSFDNTTNVIKGSQNTTEIGTTNTHIMGDKNTVKGNSRNNIIVGSENEIVSGINNVTVLGSKGKAQRPGEFVLGGNGRSLGSSQSSIIHLSNDTEDATPTSLLIGGLTNTDKTVIERDTSTTNFTAFDAHIMGVRTGGSAAGNIYDRIYLKVDGLIYLKAANQQARDRGNFGTVTGWTAEIAFSGTNDMEVKVTGAEDMTISWCCTLNLYEMTI